MNELKKLVFLFVIAGAAVVFTLSVLVLVLGQPLSFRETIGLLIDLFISGVFIGFFSNKLALKDESHDC